MIVVTSPQSARWSLSSFVIALVMAVPCCSQWDLSLGEDNTCSLSNGEVKCWGWGYWGLVGDERGDSDFSVLVPPDDPINLGLHFTAKALSVSSSHACAVSANGTLKCWGYCSWGMIRLYIMRLAAIHKNSLFGQENAEPLGPSNLESTQIRWEGI